MIKTFLNISKFFELHVQRCFQSKKRNSLHFLKEFIQKTTCSLVRMMLSICNGIEAAAPLCRSIKRGVFILHKGPQLIAHLSSQLCFKHFEPTTCRLHSFNTQVIYLYNIHDKQLFLFKIIYKIIYFLISFLFKFLIYKICSNYIFHYTIKHRKIIYFLEIHFCRIYFFKKNYFSANKQGLIYIRFMDAFIDKQSLLKVKLS